MGLTQAELDRLEFIKLLQFLKESDPDGFVALCAKAKAILVREVKTDG